MFAVGKKLLLGPSEDTSKLLFRQSLVRLAGSSIPNDDTYWTQFWTVPEAASELPSLLPSEVLRNALTANPRNIVTLLAVTCAHLFAILADPRFSREQITKGYFSTLPKEDLAREALNCVRVLSRVLPFVHERTATRAEEHRLFHDLFWKHDVKSEEGEQFVIDDEEESFRQDDATQQEGGPVLAERLLDTTMDLLFTSGFTIPHSNDPENQRTVRHVIWQAGIGSSTALLSDRNHLQNRAEVIRLLLVLLSPAVYSPNSPNPWLQHLLAISERKIALTLLCSLINTALDVAFIESFQLSTTNAYKRLASLTLSAEAKLASDLVDTLPKLAHQLLDLLLIASDAPPSSPTVSRTPSLVDTATAQSRMDNVFRFYTAKIHRQSDYAFLAERILCILSVAPPSGLVGLSVPGWNLTECVVLLWRLVDCNKGFMNYLLEAENAPDLLVCLLNICLDNKDDPAQFGLVRLCVFTLQSLTAEKSFGKQLTKSLEKVRGGKRHVPQCSNPKAADHLVISVYTLIFNTQRTFNSLYPALILCITNCSAYMKNLSAVASTRLLQLFLAFSQPSFILAEDGNPRLLYYLVEAFNNIIHHQLSDNPHLIYGIIRSHRRFESLASFTLRGAVDEIRRVRSERKSTTTEADTPTRPEFKSTSSSTSLASIGTLLNEEKFDGTDEEEPVRMSEKARGKMRERENSSDEVEDFGHPGPYRSKSGFMPTEAWVASWREHLPLDSILIMLAELRPKVSSLTSVDSPSTNQAVMDFLKSVTLLDVLPQRPPYGSRRFVHSSMSLRWLLSLVWSLVYQSTPYLSGTKIALFNVQEAQPRDLMAAVRDGTRRLTGGGASPGRGGSAVV